MRNPTSREEARAWARLQREAMTPEEDAAITAAALSDPDALPLNEATFATARPMIEGVDYPRRRGERGPQKEPTKELVSLRLDRDLVDRLRATGPGWQSRVNATLRRENGLV